MTKDERKILARIEEEKIRMFHAGKTHMPAYVWLIEKEGTLKRRERSRKTTKKPRRT